MGSFYSRMSNSSLQRLKCGQNLKIRVMKDDVKIENLLNIKVLRPTRNLI